MNSFDVNPCAASIKALYRDCVANRQVDCLRDRHLYVCFFGESHACVLQKWNVEVFSGFAELDDPLVTVHFYERFGTRASQCAARLDEAALSVSHRLVGENLSDHLVDSCDISQSR